MLAAKSDLRHFALSSLALSLGSLAQLLKNTLNKPSLYY